MRNVLMPGAKIPLPTTHHLSSSLGVSSFASGSSGTFNKEKAASLVAIIRLSGKQIHKSILPLYI